MAAQTILNRPVTVIGQTTLCGRTVLIIQLASGVITLACAKKRKETMSNSVINAPEFWEQVKQEYKPESRSEDYYSFCNNSKTFKEVWEYKDSLKIGIKAHAKEFLNQGGFDNMELGDVFLFFYIHGSSIQKMRAIRHAFIDYMLEKTKKDLQDKK